MTWKEIAGQYLKALAMTAALLSILSGFWWFTMLVVGLKAIWSETAQFLTSEPEIAWVLVFAGPVWFSIFYSKMLGFLAYGSKGNDD